MILDDLEKKELIKPPKWLVCNTAHLTVMGSDAYGVSGGNSDVDIYGFCIPPKEEVFPHLKGEILGFGRHKQRFEQWQQHHIEDKSARAGKGVVYDFAVFNIVKYFSLCMECNPNMIDSLFTPLRCILHSTNVGNIVRENRKLFLHKGAWHKFKGYAYSQMHKMDTKCPQGKRKEMIEQFGMDVKFAYHVVRLLNEVEQILTEGDLDLERNREQLKSIRRGEWTKEQIVQYFQTKELQLEKLYNESRLPYAPDEQKIKELLLNCLEEHYGNLKDCVVRVDRSIEILRQIKELVENI